MGNSAGMGLLMGLLEVWSYPCLWASFSILWLKNVNRIRSLYLEFSFTLKEPDQGKAKDWEEPEVRAATPLDTS